MSLWRTLDRWRWLVAVCAVVCLTFGRGAAQQEETKPSSDTEQESEAASSPRAVSVAVAGFENESGRPAMEPFCAGGTPPMLAARLRRVYALNVRDAAKTYDTLTAQNFASAVVPWKNLAEQRRASETVDAQYLIIGSYGAASGEGVQAETTVKVAAALLTRATGKREEVGTVEGALKDLPRLHADLTEKVLEKLRARGVPVRPSEWLEATREDAAPWDAYPLFAQGNVLWLQKKWEDAQHKFREAYQKSNGSLYDALAAFERVGRQRLEDLEKSGVDVQLEIQKEDDELKAMDAHKGLGYEFVVALRDLWKASRLRKRNATDEAKNAQASAIARLQSLLAQGSEQWLKWKVKLRSPVMPYSTDLRPTVAGDTVYAGSADGYVFAFALKTGDTAWRFRVGQPCRTTPCVAQGVVYVGCDDGALYALDAVTGKLKWKFETKAAVLSAPVVTTSVVIFGSNDRNLYAVDAASGQLKWKVETQGGVVASPRVANGVVYVGSRDKQFYAIDAASGLVKWKLPTQGEILATALIDNGVVYVGANDARAYAVDATTGSVKWKTLLDAFVQGTPCLSRDGDRAVLYVGSSKFLYALDMTSGDILWKVPTPSIPAPIVEGGAVYVTLGDENLFALDAKTGRLRWRWATDTTLFTSPRLVPPSPSRDGDRAVLLIASAQYLYALRPREAASNVTLLLEDDALFNLGLAYHDAGEYAKSRDALKRLVERRPGYNAEVYRTLAEAHRHLGQPVEEISAWLRSFALQPADAPSRDHEGADRLYQLAGLRWVARAEGRTFWQSAVDANTIFVGAEDRSVYAIEANTGQVKWKTNINAPARFAPCVGEAFVYVVNSQGSLYALDKASGAVRWRASTATGAPNGPPVLVGNQVIIGAAGGNLVATDAASGQRKWAWQIRTSISSPCAVDNMLYFTASDGNLYAFDLRLLDVRWRQNVGASLNIPVHEQGTLYLTSQSVRAVDAATGKSKWQFDPEATACSPPVVTTSVVACGANNGYVYALDKTSGSMKWRFWTLPGSLPPQVTVGMEEGALQATPSAATLYAATATGQIYALDLNTGALKWKFQAEGAFISPPTVRSSVRSDVSERLYCACGDTNVYALELAQVAQLRAQGKTWWKEQWSDFVAQAMLASDADQKRRHLQRAAELAEDNFSIHFDIGWRACDEKLYDVARQQAATLTRLDAEHPDAPWLLARVEKEEKHFAEAEKYLREVARLTPRTIKAYTELDEVMEAQGKTFVPQEVVPPQADLFSALGDVYNRKEQYAKAIAVYQRAIELDPQRWHPYNNLAWILATCKDEKLRNPQESLRLALKAVELAPRAAPILDTLAEAYFANKQYDSAIDTMIQAINLDRNNLYYRQQLAKFQKAKRGG